MDWDDSSANRREEAAQGVAPKSSSIVPWGRTKPGNSADDALFVWSSQKRVATGRTELEPWVEIRWLQTECRVKIAQKPQPDARDETIELTPHPVNGIRRAPTSREPWRSLLRRSWPAAAVAVPAASLWLVLTLGNPSRGEATSVTAPLSDAIHIELDDLPVPMVRKAQASADEARPATRRDDAPAVAAEPSITAELTQAPTFVGMTKSNATQPTPAPSLLGGSPATAEKQDTNAGAPLPQATLSSGAAVLKTFQSGRLESWSENGVEGYALAGPLRVIGERNCRTIIVWEKGGPQGGARSSEKCLSPAGVLVSR